MPRPCPSSVRPPVSFEQVIDVRRLRVELEATKAALARKGVPATEVERAATLDVEHRRLAREAEDLRGRVKVLSKQVGDAMRAGEAAKAEALREESKHLGNELAAVERESSKTEQQLRDALLRLPNLPAPDAPDGDLGGGQRGRPDRRL